MAGWTVATIYGYVWPSWRGWPLLVSDLVVTAACQLVSPWVLGAGGERAGMASVPVAWIACPVLAWAISGGRRRGGVAAVLIGTCDVITHGNGRANQVTLTATIVLLLAGTAVGHVARLAVEAQVRLQHAVELEAATRERERLARGIHDSVLQVLALVQRRGAELGGEAAELGRLAGEQETALRTLVGVGPDVGAGDAPAGDTDLRAVLSPYASAGVSLATPAHPVPLPAAVAGELALAV